MDPLWRKFPEEAFKNCGSIAIHQRQSQPRPSFASMPPIRIPNKKMEQTPYEEALLEPKMPESQWERTVLEMPRFRYGKYVLGGHWMNCMTTASHSSWQTKTRPSQKHPYVADPDAQFRMLLKIRKLRQNLAELVAKYGGPRPVAFLAGMPSKMEVEEELWKLANLPSYSCIKYYKVKRYLERQIDTYRVPESEIEGEEHFLCKIDRCKKKFRTVQGFLGHARNAHKAYSDTRTPCPEPGCVKYFQKDESLRNHVQSNDHHYSRLGYVCPMPSCAWKASTSDDAVVEHIVSYHHNTKAAEEYAQLKDIDINIVRAAREYYAVVQAEKERSELHSTWNAIAASRLPRKYVLRLA